MSSTEKQISIQDMHKLNYEERKDFWSYFGKEWEKEQREKREKIEREKEN